jgi:5-hydroxyisourate hydrolase
MSIHVVDVARGVVAAGMRVEVRARDPARVVANAVVSHSGTVDVPALVERLPVGEYDVLLHVAAFFRDAGVALPSVPFLDVATYRFGIADPEQHYHLPFKLTPWGYSCFRGGA